MPPLATNCQRAGIGENKFTGCPPVSLFLWSPCCSTKCNASTVTSRDPCACCSLGTGAAPACQARCLWQGQTEQAGLLEDFRSFLVAFWSDGFIYNAPCAVFLDGTAQVCQKIVRHPGMHLYVSTGWSFMINLSGAFFRTRGTCFMTCMAFPCSFSAFSVCSNSQNRARRKLSESY